MTDIPEHLASYLAGFPAEVQRLLRAVHQTIRQAAPDPEERLSYGMPAFFQHGAVAYFGAFKHHIGLYPPVADAALRVRAAAYCGPKGNLQFSLAQPIPHALIAEIEELKAKQVGATPEELDSILAGVQGIFTPAIAPVV